MNQKKAKALRKLVRSMGIAVGHAVYKSDKPGSRLYNTGKLGAKGLPIFARGEIAGTVRLGDGCGRSLYRAMKRAAPPAAA